MKRFLVLFASLLLLLSVSAAAAPAADQTIEITQNGDTITFIATQPATFWEMPVLRAGELSTVVGSLTVVNKTDSSRPVSFNMVNFPFDDKEALEYLNHLHITVKQEDAVVYEGPYSRINDEPLKPEMATTLAPDASCRYTITLRCDYTYSGTDKLGDNVLDWQFSTLVDDADNETETPIRDPLFTQWLIAGIATVLACIFLSRYAKRT